MADCTRPPPGWTCTRGEHPDGPCAAIENGDPKTREEYEERSAKNAEVVGYGLDTGMSFPCPCCGAKGWRTAKIVELEEALSLPIMCKACLRSVRVITERTAFSVSVRFVQTSGRAVAPWVPIPREKPEATS